ncbi:MULTISPECIES: rRNA maturation RNase YbeY [Capnocytophaga]|uniref:rRNA maturation RNase YbeY n=1 Tax=Capnocytophaga TaxID=1016 RepID=UPI00020C7054|nr:MULTISPECIES: rRNA maturation RNase YbeY [unclassified Capnocytophaga]KHE68200.1 translation metalloprotein YbeY [Capnocytophaga sp. oral taxon 329 str. F0087]QGS18227.1 rRNA maturation RNase YbeY [Capnocytophaga sp. FDAARGOS_737]
MIAFFNETSFVFLYHKNKVKQWVKQIALSEGKKIGDINYIFCDDVYLHKINVQYLQHDTLTDIITFDYTEGITLNSDIYISIERVRENADIFGVTFEQELLRVLAHGILHLCGYKDKTPADSELMRAKEDEKTKLFSL